MRAKNQAGLHQALNIKLPVPKTLSKPIHNQGRGYSLHPFTKAMLFTRMLRVGAYQNTALVW